MDDHVNTDSKKQTNSHYWIYLFLFTILLFFCVLGITYSIYYKDETGDNEINTGEIVFTYSDAGQAGNGILLEDAIPISDAVGKVMVGTHQYFDFAITTSTKNTNLLYKILIHKDSGSTLSNDNVRVYLTQLMGGYEEEKVFADFSDLKMEKIHNQDYYVLYEKKLGKELNNYSDAYRFRMWLKEDAKNYEEQYFSVKIDVYAYQIEEE